MGKYRYAESVDVKLQVLVGEALPDAAKGQVDIQELISQSNILEEYYANGLGFPTCHEYLAQFIRQLTHRDPGMKILEIGSYLVLTQKHLPQLC